MLVIVQKKTNHLQTNSVVSCHAPIGSLVCGVNVQSRAMVVFRPELSHVTIAMLAIVQLKKD